MASFDSDSFNTDNFDANSFDLGTGVTVPVSEINRVIRIKPSYVRRWAFFIGALAAQFFATKGIN